VIPLWHWLVHVTGSDYGAPYGHFVPYDFYSGSGSDLGELAIGLGLFSVYRKHNCHATRCWRIGQYMVDDTTIACRRHHPNPHLFAKLSRADLRARWAIYVEKRPGDG
jgi:hypothetical protein